MTAWTDPPPAVDTWVGVAVIAFLFVVFLIVCLVLL
jgi:hypothetical protein